jgi:hypothetical protein
VIAVKRGGATRRRPPTAITFVAVHVAVAVAVKVDDHL